MIYYLFHIIKVCLREFTMVVGAGAPTRKTRTLSFNLDLYALHCDGRTSAEVVPVCCRRRHDESCSIDLTKSELGTISEIVLFNCVVK